MERLFKSFPQL